MFFPTDFEVRATGEGGHEFVDQTLQLDISSKPGGGEGADRYIESILFVEAGHYTLSGIGTDLTNALVAASVTFWILEIDRIPVVTDPLDPFKYRINDTLTFEPSDGDYYLGTDGAADLVSWQGSLNHDFSGEFTHITRLTMSLNNSLEVRSQDGTTAFIEKKVALEQPAVYIDVEVPEPATICLLGLGGLALLRKRRA